MQILFGILFLGVIGLVMFVKFKKASRGKDCCK